MKRNHIVLPLLLLSLTACHTDPFSIKPEVPIDPEKTRPETDEKTSQQETGLDLAAQISDPDQTQTDA